MSKKRKSTTEHLRPFNVSWHITERCNYDCKFCFRPDHGEELSLNDAKLVIDKLAQAGLKKISWAGGEPMLWNGLINLIEYTKKKKIITMLITNGQLLTDSKLSRLAVSLDWLNLPLEGPSSGINDLMTRKIGHFDRTLNLIEKAKKYPNLKLKINTVASRINKDEIVRMVPIIKKYGIRRWKIFQFYPVRRISKKNAPIFSMQESDFLRLQETILPMFDPKECMVVFETNSDMDRSYFAVAPDSEVYVSYDYDDYFIGNLLNDDPEKIFSNSILDKIKYWERSKWVMNGESAEKPFMKNYTDTSSGIKKTIPLIK